MEITQKDMLKDWRHRLGMTQLEASVALGLSIGSIKSIESGRRDLGERTQMLMTCIYLYGDALPWGEFLAMNKQEKAEYAQIGRQCATQPLKSFAELD